MISDSIPEDTVYPDSIHPRGYLKNIKWTCSCGHKNLSQIPVDADIEKILEYCPACAVLNEIDLGAAGDGE